MKLKQFAAASIMIALALLAGCGGGGSTPPAPVMKGFWNGTTGTVNTSAIVLANGDTWVVFQENNVTTRFARLQTQTIAFAYSGVGTQYLLQSGTTETASASGTFTEKSLLSGTMTSVSTNTPLSLAYNSRYDTPAILADAVGSWTGSFGNGNSTVTMNVSGTGTLSGTSTTACTYNGTMQPRVSDPAVFDTSFTEACLVGARTLYGIATVNAAKTSLFFATTTADKASGALFVGQKL